MSIYDIAVTTIQGEVTSMSEYKGKYVLIVNTASKCGLTPHYRGLQQIFEEYHAKGLEILGFPCNQFAGQEPGSNEDIQSFCELTYQVSFPMFAKIDVKGDHAHPLYTYLLAHTPDQDSKEIEWNFVKFLVSPQGEVLKKYSAKTEPEVIREDLAKMI